MRDAICKRYHSVERRIGSDKEGKSDSQAERMGVMKGEGEERKEIQLSRILSEKEKIPLKSLLRYSFCRIIYLY